MYEVDDRDRVVELADIPRSSVGAPCPAIWASEHEVRVAYYLQEWPDHKYRDATGDVLEPNSEGEPLAILSIRHRALMFGPPNDEAFSGHPLASRGLHPYGAFEILDSSWVRRL